MQWKPQGLGRIYTRSIIPQLYMMIMMMRSMLMRSMLMMMMMIIIIIISGWSSYLPIWISWNVTIISNTYHLFATFDLTWCVAWDLSNCTHREDDAAAGGDRDLETKFQASTCINNDSRIVETPQGGAGKGDEGTTWKQMTTDNSSMESCALSLPSKGQMFERPLMTGANHTCPLQAMNQRRRGKRICLHPVEARTAYNFLWTLST